ncbi:MAG: hypothetical protein K6F56_04995 [Oscillospiraceae bacterium]|nr:hypothetical protein [Oscillospiraceae bacterium]
MDKEPQLEYDVQKRAKASTAATFRAVVALYFLYLARQIIRGAMDGSSSMSPVLAWIAGLGFIAAALAFGFYTWKRWRAEVEAARLTPAETDDDTETP